MPLTSFIDLCLLRAQPQDLSGTVPLLVGALIAHVTVDVISLLDVLPAFQAFAGAIVDTVLLVAVAHMALLARNAGNRALKTVTALAGCGAIMSACAVVATALLRDSVAPGWIVLPFVIWYVLVYGHIVRHAFAIPFGLATAFAALYLVLSIGVSGAMFPLPAEE